MKETPFNVRLEPEQKALILSLEKELGGSRGAAVRHLLILGERWRNGERPPVTSSPDLVTGVPLAAEGVGADKQGQLELIPDGEHPYFFRRSFLARKGWTASAPNRFAIYKLGTDEIANSMDPTIAPDSVVLVDREADRDAVESRSIWVVRDTDGLILKRVTVEDGFIVLESDNRHPEFAPRVLHVSKKERHRTLVGRVVWHAAELA